MGQVVTDLGWVDLDLGCSTILLGQQVATVPAHQLRELPKSKSTKPRSATTCPAMYILCTSFIIISMIIYVESALGVRHPLRKLRNVQLDNA